MNRTFRICGLAAAFTLLASFSLFAQSRGFQFLRNTIGARPAAMAGAFTAVDGDIYAIVANPAALVSITQKQGTFDYVNHVLDIQSGFGAFVLPMTQGNLAFAVYYNDYGEFEQLNEFNESQGTFSANSIVLTAVFAREYTKQLAFGAAVKYIRSSIHTYSAQGLAVDLTAFYNSGLFENLKIGGGVYNLGAQTTAFIEQKDGLPTRFELGVSKSLAHLPLTYSATVLKYIDDDFQFAAGGEFKLSDNLFLRLGYNSLGRNQKLINASDRFAGVSTGFGLHIRNYRLDYSFSSWGTIGSVNRFSLTLKI